jgi:hypothetical protein
MPPSLDWVPNGQVPQRHQYYEALRLPEPNSGLLMDSLPTPRSVCSGSLRCTEQGASTRPLISQGAHQALSTGRTQDLSGYRQTCPCLCHALRFRSAQTNLAASDWPDTAPTPNKMKAPTRMISELNSGFNIRCLRFTNAVTDAHARLASGWLARLYREGVEPSRSVRKVSHHLILLSRPYPDASWAHLRYYWAGISSMRAPRKCACRPGRA